MLDCVYLQNFVRFFHVCWSFSHTLGGSRKMVSAPQAFDSPGLKEEEE